MTSAHARPEQTTFRNPRQLVVAFLVLSWLAVGLPGLSSADPAQVNTDRTIAAIVTSQMQRGHISRHPIDDEIARRWLKNYVKTLDPWKVYFYQSDIDEFKKHEDQLDDMVLQKDLHFGFEIFTRFLQRVDERIKLVEQILKETPDLTVDEEMELDTEKVEFAKNQTEAYDNWRKRIKLDLLQLKAGEDKLEGEKAIEKLERRYHGVSKRWHQADHDEVLEMYLSALTTSYDPHTTYMSPDTTANFNILMKLKLSGIGASLQFNDGYTTVHEVISGSAAFKDGRLKPKDRVIGVGQGPKGEIEDVQNMKLNDVVRRIRGPSGSIVRLQVIPDGKADPVVYDITRAEVELKDSEARSITYEEGKKANGQPVKVGVIDLQSFYMDMDAARKGYPDYKSTTADVRRLLTEFQEKNVDVVVIDLRKNGGGSLTEAISLTGLFIDAGPVVQVKDSGGQVHFLDDTERGMAWNGPLVVLTSKFSASASEIFAGAIQDYHRGIILGDHSTHGKGTVQSLMDLGEQLFGGGPNPPALGSLKITQQQFYRPNGDSTQDRGVVADIELPSLSSHYDIGESSFDYALKFDRVPPNRYQQLGFVNSSIIKELSDRSAERRQQSTDFQKLEKKIVRYDEQQKRKRVRLNEEKFMSDRAELNAQEEEDKDHEELSSQNHVIFKRDFYGDEALNVAVDYFNLLTNRPNVVKQATNR